MVTEANVREALRKESAEEPGSWGLLIRTLDEINFLTELDSLRSILTEAGKEELFAFYQKRLQTWPNPELSGNFKEKFPLLSAKLDSPQKIRVLFRAAAYRGVHHELMAEVMETLLKKMDRGERRIVYETYECSKWYKALRIVVCLSEFQAWTLCVMLFGSYKTSISFEKGLVIEFLED